MTDSSVLLALKSAFNPECMISVILLLAGLCGMIGTICWILRCGNNNRMTKLFMICQISIVLWLVSQLLILFSESKRQLWISYIIGNAGICCFAPFWLMFSAEYTENYKKIMKVLCIFPPVTFMFIVLNPVHRLYYTDFDENSIEYGVLFYIFQLLFYVLIISGIVLISTDKKNRRSKIMLVLATSVPLIVNILSIGGVINSDFELTPLFFAFSVIMILIAIRRYGLLNINRIAINNAIDNISTAVIVFNADGCMTYRNKYSDKIIDFTDISNIDDFFEMLGTENSDIELDGIHYNVKRSSCVNGKSAEIAQVIIINNVSEYYELAEAEKKLSIEHERNRIAQEIHDTAGHIFTVISSMAKILQVETEREKILEYVSEIDGLSRSGITQLRCSINNLRDDEFMTSVTKAVQTVVSAVRNISVEVCVQGTENESFSFCIREVYENIREIMTNTMRYSGADRVDIIIKFLDNRLEIYVFDNGKGCAEIHENNGLSGIRSRTENIGGEVRFSSVENEGFTTVIKIPKTNQRTIN